MPWSGTIIELWAVQTNSKQGENIHVRYVLAYSGRFGSETLQIILYCSVPVNWRIFCAARRVADHHSAPHTLQMRYIMFR